MKQWQIISTEDDSALELRHMFSQTCFELNGIEHKQQCGKNFDNFRVKVDRINLLLTTE